MKLSPPLPSERQGPSLFGPAREERLLASARFIFINYIYLYFSNGKIFYLISKNVHHAL